MTLIERATKSANSVADQTVSTVSQIGTAVAEGVVVTTRDIRTGMREGNIRPRTAVIAAAVGLIAVVEWPILLAAGGVALLASKLKKRTPEAESESETEAEIVTAE
ncbi:hypothetical protein AWC29_00720 [Mycobacterium triplex]|uniref:Transmembrane protein n=1 Tax=Mycobacterium triplex TaxID=47839 RepID=A0A024K181_9MYCO|nr:hypothetical protein [Mycobacterium triplex]ORX06030.1 hypothetical protein AWC29_00720 [Mycobacterium triplex]CDO89825.1 hypothetical protein BN973_04211 [Mycobacterium triplex]